MVSYWVYLTLGIIVALIALGAVATRESLVAQVNSAAKKVISAGTTPRW